MTPIEKRAALDDLASDMGDEELDVMLVLARRVMAGQRAYGKFDLAHDARDWRKEQSDELADFLVYGAVAEVAETIRRGAP